MSLVFISNFTSGWVLPLVRSPSLMNLMVLVDVCNDFKVIEIVVLTFLFTQSTFIRHTESKLTAESTSVYFYIKAPSAVST